MKTLIFTSADGTKKVETKVDIFGTLAEIGAAGFDTKFTNMQIVRDEAALIDGIDFKEMDKSLRTLIDLAMAKGYALQAIDLNESSPINLVTATALTGTVAGTKGASTLTGTTTDFDPELDVNDKIYVDGFVYTVSVRASAADTTATIAEAFNTTFSGETAYVIAEA